MTFEEFLSSLKGKSVAVIGIGVSNRPLIELLLSRGIAVTAFNVAFQAETIRYAPEDAAPVAMSIFSGIYNVGIGCGALFGGAVCTYLSVADIGYAGGVLAVAAVVFCLCRLLPLLKGRIS